MYMYMQMWINCTCRCTCGCIFTGPCTCCPCSGSPCVCVPGPLLFLVVPVIVHPPVILFGSYTFPVARTCACAPKPDPVDMAPKMLPGDVGIQMTKDQDLMRPCKRSKVSGSSSSKDKDMQPGEAPCTSTSTDPHGPKVKTFTCFHCDLSYSKDLGYCPCPECSRNLCMGCAAAALCSNEACYKLQCHECAFKAKEPRRAFFCSYCGSPQQGWMDALESLDTE